MLSIRGIGEIKYKPKIKEQDRYQVISHAVALNAPLGIWISPAGEGNAGLEYIGALSTGTKFYHYRFDVSSDPATSQSSMVASVGDLLLK